VNCDNCGNLVEKQDVAVTSCEAIARLFHGKPFSCFDCPWRSPGFS
jgi:hypothetical protein